MSIEIEAKMSVLDLDPVREALKRENAGWVSRTLERNSFFDTADRILLAGDEGLRLRTTRDLQTERQEHVITFKGPLQVGRLKSREEIEVIVSDRPSAETLFQRLRFVPVLTFEKRRESWWKMPCHVELDEMPYLGTFVEIEGPDEEAVMAVRERIGLSDRPIIKTSYIGLLLAHLEERGLSPTEVTFAGAV